MKEKEFRCELFFYGNKCDFIKMKYDLNTYFDKHFEYPRFY